MQKFTRALTREVEIGGERMAVTLSEQGVAIRPVGSRKPPTEVTWDAVLAAAGTPAPARAPAVKDDSPAGHALARLDGWLAKHRPVFHDGLMDPATAAELSALAASLGRPVPDELASWLHWHNGQGEEGVGSLVGAFNVLGSEEIADEYAERQKGASDGPWHAGWLPLLDDFQGDLVCLDTTRPGHPVIEVWRGKDEAEDVAPSLAEWVTGLVAEFEAGNYVEDPERGEFLKKR
ncbi:MAG: SMI1/KNR4 family protein [Gemmataceae bacterium]